MSEYQAPVRDMQFVLKELVGLEAVAQLPGCEEVTADLVDQILDESARFCAGRSLPRALRAPARMSRSRTCLSADVS